ncbi:MAG TPA: hypothetical protein VF079_01815 [Sphingomicrobium sp.]
MFDHVRDMTIFVAAGGTAARVEAIRKGELRRPGHVATTLVCVFTINIGVAVGTHVEVLDWTTSGCPSDSTRWVPDVHCPVTHGPFPALGGGMVQPTMAIGDVTWMLGAPESVTRGLGLVAVAVPA